MCHVCECYRGKGDLFVLSWARVQRVRQESISSELLMCGVISLYFMCVFSINGSVCLVCCVFVNCLVKQFAKCLLLNVMKVFSVSTIFGCTVC